VVVTVSTGLALSGKVSVMVSGDARVPLMVGVAVKVVVSCTAASAFGRPISRDVGAA
jgi:hypothetical protein